MSSLGSLNINLSLETAQFNQALNKSGHQTQKFVRQFEANFSAAQNRAKQFSERTTQYLNNIERAANSINKTTAWSFRIDNFSRLKEVASQTLKYADKLNVSSLSAISANMGSITAGAIKIGSLNGNYGTLFEVASNGGFRLIARDSSGGIELSSSRRALSVWNGANEIVKVGKL
ncbi:hypothetical protein A1D23_06155 [Chelonobacter oris]|uniref:hypothetical protein n=1 Tax=Chelonobacter oris TaxID=505317 RepID=UPI002A317786|nr:hypothetical protein [Chelonobacter oris]